MFAVQISPFLKGNKYTSQLWLFRAISSQFPFAFPRLQWSPAAASVVAHVSPILNTLQASGNTCACAQMDLMENSARKTSGTANQTPVAAEPAWRTRRATFVNAPLVWEVAPLSLLLWFNYRSTELQDVLSVASAKWTYINTILLFCSHGEMIWTWRDDISLSNDKEKWPKALLPWNNHSRRMWTSLLLPAHFPWICPSMRWARRLSEREKRQRSRALLHLTGFHLIKLGKELRINEVSQV